MATIVIDDTLSSASTSAHNPLNSRPYLDDYFELKSQKQNSLKILCKVCAPKTSEICACINSPCNLQKHMKVS